MGEEAVEKRLHKLKMVPEIFKVDVRMTWYILENVPDQYKTQEMMISLMGGTMAKSSKKPKKPRLKQRYYLFCSMALVLIEELLC